MLGCRWRKACRKHLSLQAWSFCSPVCRDTKSLSGPMSLVLPGAAAARHHNLENERGKGNVVFKEILDSLIKLLFQSSSNGK